VDTGGALGIRYMYKMIFKKTLDKGRRRQIAQKKISFSQQKIEIQYRYYAVGSKDMKRVKTRKKNCRLQRKSSNDQTFPETGF
jgi:hypothetical protein